MAEYGDIDCDGDEDMMVSSDGLPRSRNGSYWFVYLAEGDGTYTFTGETVDGIGFFVGLFEDGDCYVRSYYVQRTGVGLEIYREWQNGALVTQCSCELFEDEHEAMVPDEYCGTLLNPISEMLPGKTWAVRYQDNDISRPELCGPLPKIYYDYTPATERCP